MKRNAVAVHMACNRVLVMYPMKKSTVVVDSIACSFPLGYYFRTAPCKYFPERNQCGNLHACRYLIWYHVELHELKLVEHLQLVAFYTMVHSRSCNCSNHPRVKVTHAFLQCMSDHDGLGMRLSTELTIHDHTVVMTTEIY